MFLKNKQQQKIIAVISEIIDEQYDEVTQKLEEIKKHNMGQSKLLSEANKEIRNLKEVIELLQYAISIHENINKKTVYTFYTYEANEYGEPYCTGIDYEITDKKDKPEQPKIDEEEITAEDIPF